MSFPVLRGFRRDLLLLAAVPIAAAAQQPAPVRPQNLPPGAVVQPLQESGPGAELRRHLTTLAQNPQSVEALVGAGRAALDMGDAQASITFFARADEIAPRDPRVKAGMASAFVQLEQPQAALALFGEAMALGAPEAAIAGDRGLAHDMIGEPARAQHDYALALRRNEDPELQRRLALSLAISGRREEALRTIQAQLRRNDRAAVRTQAFVLALTGDVAGARRAAESVMPPASVEAMAPFFARLSHLTPAQKALAANFGHIPNEGGPVRVAANIAPAPAPAGGPAISAMPAPRQRPDAAPPPERPAVEAQRPVQIARNEARPVTTSEPPLRRFQPSPEPAARVEAAIDSAERAAPPPPSAPPPRPTSPPVAPSPAPEMLPPRAQAEPPQSAPVALPRPAPAADAQAPIATELAAPAAATVLPSAAPPSAIGSVSLAPTTTALPPSSVAQTDLSSPGFSLSPQGRQPASPVQSAAATPLASPSAPAATPQAGRTMLADIADLVNSLPVEEPNRSTETRSRSGNTARTRTAARDAAAPPARSAAQRNQRQRPPPNPSRHWVQVAGGADRTSLPREFARLRDLAPALLRARLPFITATRTTNRLLVGPFESPAEAQEFVNQLARRNVAAFAWASEAGQEIERLQMPR